MSFYTDLQRTVGKLIADKGQIVTLRRASVGAYNLATGTASEGTTVLYSASAVVADFPAKEIDLTTIMRGDRKVLLPVSSSLPEPQVGDAIDIGGVRHAVTYVKVTRPGGTAVLYTLGARAGG